MNKTTIVLYVVVSLFLGFLLGSLFTYSSIAFILEKAASGLSGSNVQIEVGLNESKLVEGIGGLLYEKYNLSKDLNQLNNLSILRSFNGNN